MSEICSLSFYTIYRDIVGKEDNCLSLNIYTPSKLLQQQREDEKEAGLPSHKTEERLLPVIIWIHGGAFNIGSGSDFFYGPLRAMDQDVVLVIFQSSIRY